jgi:hypothetical protein
MSNDEHDFREGEPSMAVALVLIAGIFTVGFVLGAWFF